jgi:hypothetical protein
MRSSVLRSEPAVLVHVEIMRAFVQLRQMPIAHADRSRRLDALAKKYAAPFKIVFDAFRELLVPAVAPKRGRIGFAREEEG